MFTKRHVQELFITALLSNPKLEATQTKVNSLMDKSTVAYSYSRILQASENEPQGRLFPKFPKTCALDF